MIHSCGPSRPDFSLYHPPCCNRHGFLERLKGLQVVVGVTEEHEFDQLGSCMSSAMAIEDAAAKSMEHPVDSQAFTIVHFQHSMTGAARSGRVTALACIGTKPLQVPHEVNQR